MPVGLRRCGNLGRYCILPRFIISNRQIAKTLGVDAETVRRDTGAANAAPSSKDANNTKDVKGADAANAAPALLSGTEAARTVAPAWTQHGFVADLKPRHVTKLFHFVPIVLLRRAARGRAAERDAEE
jgi:hypothetical protein